METSTKENGRTVLNTEEVKTYLRMEIGIEEHTLMESLKERVYTHG
jgi:DNA-directed RNA polymerase subunit L